MTADVEQIPAYASITDGQVNETFQVRTRGNDDCPQLEVGIASYLLTFLVGIQGVQRLLEVEHVLIVGQLVVQRSVIVLQRTGEGQCTQERLQVR